MSKFKNPSSPLVKTFRSASAALNTIEYKLSNEDYVQLGWTKKPTARSTRKIIIYETEVAKPHLKWHRCLSQDFYPDGGLFYLNEDREGRVYYPNGKLAIKIARPEGRNYNLYTIYSPGGRNSRGVHRDPQMLANFDTLGNGLVLNEEGVTRLSYNQIGGIYVDNPGALLPLVWAWNRRKTAPIMGSTYTEASAARLLKILEANEQLQKRVARERDVQSSNNKCFSDEDTPTEDRGAIESLTAVKPICLRLNEFLSLRILDRRNINLRFLSGRRTVRFQMGFNVNYERPLTSSLRDATTDPHLHLKSRVYDAWNSLNKVTSSSSLFQILQDYRNIRKMARKRQRHLPNHKLMRPKERD